MPFRTLQGFDVDTAALADRLREVADGIESNHIPVSGITTKQDVPVEDATVLTVSLDLVVTEEYRHLVDFVPYVTDEDDDTVTIDPDEYGMTRDEFLEGMQEVAARQNNE